MTTLALFCCAKMSCDSACGVTLNALLRRIKIAFNKRLIYIDLENLSNKWMNRFESIYFETSNWNLICYFDEIIENDLDYKWNRVKMIKNGMKIDKNDLKWIENCK